MLIVKNYFVNIIPQTSASGPNTESAMQEVAWLMFGYNFLFKVKC